MKTAHGSFVVNNLSLLHFNIVLYFSRLFADHFKPHVVLYLKCLFYIEFLFSLSVCHTEPSVTDVRGYYREFNLCWVFIFIFGVDSVIFVKINRILEIVKKKNYDYNLCKTQLRSSSISYGAVSSWTWFHSLWLQTCSYLPYVKDLMLV